MTTFKQVVFASVLVFALFATATAQQSPATSAASSLPITAVAVGDRVRITVPSSIVQMRVEVYAASGEKLFDQEIRGGNVFDWHLQDGQAQRLATGAYVCVVTVKSVSGKLAQKIGTVSVREESVSVQPAESSQLTPTQAQTIGPIEENSSWMIAGEGGPQTSTVIANDGTDGQLIRGRGDLTFRIGNFFTGIDKEQMRLTEAGNLGIGTSQPGAKLDVAGTIRAQRFLIAKPKVPEADKSETLAADAAATESAGDETLVAGSGTQDRIAKWVDNAGTLGDSVIAESSGNIGIGTTSPTHKLDVQNTGANGAIRSVNETFGIRGLISEQHSSNVVGAIFVGLKSRGTLAAPTAVVPGDFGAFFSNKWYDGTSYVQSGAFGFTVDGPVSTGVVPTRLSFVTSTTSGDGPTAHGVERMTILSGGNVGIGTTAPAARLHVAGAVIASGNFSSAGDVHVTGNLTVDANTMFVNATNNRVGIGTATPAATLDVVGNLKASGDVNFTGLRTQANATSPNVIGGFLGNTAAPGVHGATIGGGGFGGFVNQVLGEFGTVGGGSNNTATSFGTVSGGRDNFAGGVDSAVAGGRGNAAGGLSAAVPGGQNNSAAGDFSFAAGLRAKANHAGAFVWGDSTPADFASTAPNQFLIRASGGVGIGTATPLSRLDVRDGDLFVGLSTAPVTNFSFPTRSLWVANDGGHANNSLRVDGSNNNLYLAARSGTGSPTGAGIVLRTGPAGAGEFDRVYINPDGNVGIGTTSPAAKLDVNGSALFNTVGVGTTNPAATLDVNGSARFNTVTFSEKTAHLSLPPHAFVGEKGGYGYEECVLAMLCPRPFTESQTYTASVILPDGARVTQLRAFIADSNGERDLTLRLEGHYQDRETGWELMAQVTSNDAGNGELYTDSSISFAVIDNSVKFYRLVFSVPNGDFRIGGVRIRYTYTSP